MYDLCGMVIGAAMAVHRELGPGFLESVYKRALQHELVKMGHTAILEHPLNVTYDGVIVGTFSADLFVDSELIVEVKAVANLVPAHEVQLVNYLNAAQLDVGLLLNFGGKSLEYRKKFRNPPPPRGAPPSLN